jgi:hypothetical protein
MVAVRVSLAVATGGPAEMYRIATGMIDEDETAVLLSGLASIIRASTVLSSPQASGTVELDVRTTSVRIGVLRAGTESVAFVQAGDARQLGRRSIWETAATLYLPVSDLPALTTAITQAAAAADTMRSR